MENFNWILIKDGDTSKIEEDLVYFRNEIIRLTQNGELTSDEMMDIADFTKEIIRHIADGKSCEERMVNIMGGEIFETASERCIMKGKINAIYELVSDGDLSLQKAAKKLKVTIEQLISDMEKAGYACPAK